MVTLPTLCFFAIWILLDGISWIRYQEMGTSSVFVQDDIMTRDFYVMACRNACVMRVI